jgi:Transposase IS116/IS110/IS902 family
MGLQAPARLAEVESTTRAGDRVDALTTDPLWRDQAIALLAPRADSQLLVQRPRLGQPTAAAILTAIGALHADQNGTQLVKRAGLALRVFASGSSMRKLPKIAHVGSASLR